MKLYNKVLLLDKLITPLCVLCLITFSLSGRAQQLIGTNGLSNIPTADMQKAGTFEGGVRWVHPKFETDSRKDATAIFTVAFTPFDFLELTFRETYYSDIDNMDRSITGRLRPIAERKGKWWPSIVLGTNDIYIRGYSAYANIYGVATKHFGGKWGTIGLHTGFSKPIRQGETYDGVFGGINYQLPYDKVPIELMIDYDTRFVNYAVQATLLNHLKVLVGGSGSLGVNLGLTYHYTIKY